MIHAKAATALQSIAEDIKLAHSINGEFNDTTAQDSHQELLAIAHGIQQEAMLKSDLIDHLLVMLDVIEDEKYDSHRERKHAAMADLGLAHLVAKTTPSAADLAAQLRHIAGQMRDIGETMQYIGGFGQIGKYGTQLQSASSVARGWAEQIEADHAPQQVAA